MSLGVRTRGKGGGLFTLSGVAVVVVGLLVAVIASTMSSWETRWIVYPILGILGLGGLLFVSAFIEDVRPILFTGFFLSLQLGLSLYLPYRGTGLSVGHSGPEGIQLPLTVFLAIPLLCLEYSRRRSTTSEAFDWGGPMVAPIVAMFISLAISLVMSPERFFGVAYILHVGFYAIVFLAALNAIHDWDDVGRAVRLLLLVLLLQAGVYFVQYSLGITFTLAGKVWEGGGLARYGGTVSTKPNAYATFVVPLLLLAVAQIVVRGRALVNPLLLASAVLGAGALVLTLSRGGWASALVGTAVVVVLATWRRYLRDPRPVLVIIVGLLLLMVVFQEPIASRMEADFGAAAEERLYLIRLAIAVIEDNFFIGTGPATYGFVFRNYLDQVPPPTSIGNPWLYLVHSEPLMRWAELGILGLSVFVWFYWRAFRVAAQASRIHERPIVAALGIGVCAGILASAFHMNLDTWRGFPTNALQWTLFGVVLAVVRLHTSDLNRKESLSDTHEKGIPVGNS